MHACRHPATDAVVASPLVRLIVPIGKTIGLFEQKLWMVALELQGAR
jgi:hypothetical protein